jgi:DNA-binding CsgD family transcriptional regulator
MRAGGRVAAAIFPASATISGNARKCAWLGHRIARAPMSVFAQHDGSQHRKPLPFEENAAFRDRRRLTVSRQALVGRDDELAATRQALDQAAAGNGRVLVLEGGPGLGKSSLLAEARHGARGRGLDVATARARAEDREIRGAMRRRSLVRAENGAGSSVREKIGWLVRSGESRAPRGLFLDDIHRADEGSLRALLELAEHSHASPVLLMVALRPHVLQDAQRRAVEALSELEHARRLTLRPLRREHADRIVHAALPEATPAFCDECAVLSAGNPFVLNELITWITAKGLEPVAGAPSRALAAAPHRAMRQFVAAQLEDVGPEAATLATAAAMREGELSVEQAARFSGLDPERGAEAVDRLRQSGLIVGGEPLSFASPITGRCLRAQAQRGSAADVRSPESERGRGHRSTADAIPHHLLLAPPAGDPHVVEQLVELADDKLAGGNPREATDFIRRALAERADGAHTKADLLVRLGHADLLQGRATSTASLWAAVASLKRADRRAEALFKLGLAQVAAGSPYDASLAFDAARDVGPADAQLRDRAEVTSALAGLLVPENRPAAVAHIDRLLAAADLTERPCGAEVLLAAAWSELCRGAPADKVVRLTGRALEFKRRDDGVSLGAYFDTVAAAVVAFVDDFAGAERLCDEARAVARAAGSLLAERNLDVAQAFALLHAGRVTDAARYSQRVLTRADEIAQFPIPGAAAVLAQALLEQDARAEAGAVLEKAAGAATGEFQRLFLCVANASVGLQCGDLAPALAAVQDAQYIAEGLGIVNPAVVAWQPLAALCYLASGDRRRAQEHATEAAEIAESFGTPRAIALTLRALACVEGPPTELERLERACAAVESSGAGLEHAKARVEYGAALHRGGHPRAARRSLRRGIDLADELGAQRVARIGIGALVAAGGRPRRVRTTGPRALTPAERRVVDLASSGLSNPEIAETLVIARKTVEWHLSKAFGKLDVSSREELPEAAPRVAPERRGARAPA